jgi:hypothetical protein
MMGSLGSRLDPVDKNASDSSDAISEGVDLIEVLGRIGG